VCHRDAFLGLSESYNLLSDANTVLPPAIWIS